MKLVTPRIINMSIATLSLITIAIFICTQSKGILYDESYFIPNISRLQHLGLSKDFLLQLTGSPGPTYAVIHSFFTGLTNGEILKIRLVNYFLLTFTLFFIYLNAKLLKAKDPVTTSLNFILVPIVWVICGLALTEIPTMLCAMVSLFFVLLCLKSPRLKSLQFVYALMAGLFQSFAIMGRSFFIMSAIAVVICVLFYFFIGLFNKHGDYKLLEPTKALYNKQILLLASLFVIASLILPLKVFSIWHSLAPPTETQIVGADNLTLVPWHAILSFSYCGFVTVIVAPGWFVIKRQGLIVSTILSFCFLLCNLYGGYLEFAPFLTAANKIFNRDQFNIYQRCVPALIFFVSIQFLISSVVRLWQCRRSPVILYIGITALLIAFSAIKVKVQFSSRYVAQIVPYMLLLFIPYDNNNPQKIIRVSVGAVLGFVSIYFYYHG